MPGVHDEYSASSSAGTCMWDHIDYQTNFQSIAIDKHTHLFVHHTIYKGLENSFSLLGLVERKLLPPFNSTLEYLESKCSESTLVEVSLGIGV